VSISVHSTPSRTVGGDFYDFIKIDEHRLGIVIADASGKGMPAALLIAQIQAIIRSEVSNGNSIGAMLYNMNKQVHSSSSSEKFVTLFYGELDTRCGTLKYANAGHNYPILVRSGGAVEPLITGGPLIGAFSHLKFQEASTALSPDDLLLMFTDGLCEAMNEQEEEYGEDRLQRFVAHNRVLAPDALVNQILADVRQFDPADPPRDDTTIVAMKMLAVKGFDDKRSE
jgi:sigma-B regulation protein RsbU (phosphoserine phosphatase)